MRREDRESVRTSRRQKRRILALARLLVGLEFEARRQRPWEPRKVYRLS